VLNLFGAQLRCTGGLLAQCFTVRWHSTGVAHGHAGRLQGGPAAPAESAHNSRCAIGVRATAGARGAVALGGDLDGGGGGDSVLTSGEEEEAVLGSEN
jgi:hypothetical protein